MKQYLQIATTTASKEAAAEIGDELIQNRLAACVQIVGPIESRYRWKGKIQNATEWLCLIKTRADLFKHVESTINRKHKYMVPEILATSIAHGSKEYVSWLDRELIEEGRLATR